MTNLFIIKIRAITLIFIMDKYTMIGTRDWMNLTNGQLSFKEKLQFIQQVFIPATTNYSKTFFKHESNLDALTTYNIQIPDTHIVKEAFLELAQSKSQAIINHSWRCYFWGLAIAQHKKWQFDDESFVISCLMHDLGLVDHLEAYACQCFTFESALRAENLCLKHHYPKDKMENISNAICLHMNGHLDESNQKISKEALLLQKAASCDVIGTDLSVCSSLYKNDVLTQYPRLQFNLEMRKLIKIETQRNPHSRTALISKLGLPLMIKMNIFEE